MDNRPGGNNHTDAYTPKEMASRAEAACACKAGLGFIPMLLLAALAGAFIALGACFYTTVITGVSAGFGFTRIVGGLAFSLGLILVVVTGAELFTGNCLMTVPLTSGRIGFARMMRNWVIVYLGNMLGSLVVAALVYFSLQWQMGNGEVGLTAYRVAGAKMSKPFIPMFTSGILCNMLVCLAVWLCYSARSTTDKILSIVFPITAFVALGFEHSIANMFFVPYGIALAHTGAFVANAGGALSQYPTSLFTPSQFITANLIPVTLGNIVGGSVFVGMVYWAVFLRGRSQPCATTSERTDERTDDVPESILSLRREA